MAICDWCYLEMTDPATVDCPDNRTVEYPDGVTLPAVPYDPGDFGNERCHDCYVVRSGYHHPGCDMERCPRCGGQLISCGCLDADDNDYSYSDYDHGDQDAAGG